ncbi:MAG: FAD:protein FMN transferase [Pseudomonadota bacterium]
MKPHLEKRLHVFGSPCRLVISAGTHKPSELLELSELELKRLESKFGSFFPGSVVSNINQAAGTGAFTPLDAESRSLLTFVSALWAQSNHLFDPTTWILRDCYSAEGRLRATAEQVKGMLKLVGWSALEITPEGARLPKKGMVINLDSCVRPYVIDTLRKQLIKEEVGHALIEMDSDAVSIGKQYDGANWMVGMRHPRGPRTAIARFKLNDQGFALRGDFEKRVKLAGENFGQALSPVDAQPLPGLLGVAVVAQTSLEACGAATIARLKTEEAGLSWLAKLGLPWMAIDRSLRCHGPLSPSH